MKGINLAHFDAVALGLTRRDVVRKPLGFSWRALQSISMLRCVRSFGNDHCLIGWKNGNFFFQG